MIIIITTDNGRRWRHAVSKSPAFGEVSPSPLPRNRPTVFSAYQYLLPRSKNRGRTCRSSVPGTAVGRPGRWRLEVVYPTPSEFSLFFLFYRTYEIVRDRAAVCCCLLLKQKIFNRRIPAVPDPALLGVQLNMSNSYGQANTEKVDLELKKIYWIFRHLIPWMFSVYSRNSLNVLYEIIHAGAVLTRHFADFRILRKSDQ